MRAIFIVAVVIGVVFSTTLLAAPRRCRGALKAARVGMDLDLFEDRARADFADFETRIEKAEELRMIGLRDQLAQIENANPQGFNTFTHRRRDGLRVQIRSLLRLGQDRRVKMLVGKMVTDLRHDFREFQSQEEAREEVLQAYFDANFHQRDNFSNLIRAIDENRFVLKRAIGRQLWLYSGVVGVLLEEAGLKTPQGLISDGIDRALLEDQSRAFLRAGLTVETVAPPAAYAQEDVAKIVALRVLQALRVIGSDGKTEISPTLAEFERLYVASASIRTAKLESEIQFERRHQRVQYLLSIASDQYLLKLIANGLNSLTLGKFKEFFADTQKELERGINQNIHQGRILEFLGLADRLSNDATGNGQLTTALITLLGTDSSLLGSLAATEEGIEPLQRVKGTPVAKTTVWGPKGQSLTSFIEELEGLRSTQGITSAINIDNRRSHFLLKATAAALVTYGAVVHYAHLPHIGFPGVETVKAMIAKFPH